MAPPPQDFEVYYEVRLGIRREPAEGDGDDRDDGRPPLRGSDQLSGRPAVSRANGGADLAVFEQFERMVRRLLYLRVAAFADDGFGSSSWRIMQLLASLVLIRRRGRWRCAMGL